MIIVIYLHNCIIVCCFLLKSTGIYAMPVATSGRPLPNPRILSTRLFADRSIFSRVLTHLNVQWGQFITHDLIFAVMEVTGTYSCY